MKPSETVSMPSARMSPWDSPKSGLSFEDASRAMMYGSSPCRTCTAQTNHDHCTAPPSAPKASTQQCPHSTRHTCSIGCDQNPVQQTPPTTVRHAPGQRNRSRPARAGRRSACPAGTCTHQLRSRTATRAMFSGKSKIRILSRSYVVPTGHWSTLDFAAALNAAWARRAR